MIFISLHYFQVFKNIIKIYFLVFMYERLLKIIMTKVYLPSLILSHYKQFWQSYDTYVIAGCLLLMKALKVLLYSSVQIIWMINIHTKLKMQLKTENLPIWIGQLTK